MDAVAQPFESSAENALQIFAQGVIFFTLAAGGMVQTGGNSDADASYKTATVDSNAVSALIIVINVAVFAGAAALLWLNHANGFSSGCRRRAPQIGASNEDANRDAGSTVATQHSHCPSACETNVQDGRAKLTWQGTRDKVLASLVDSELHQLAGGDGDMVDTDADARSGWTWLRPFIDEQLATEIDDEARNE